MFLVESITRLEKSGRPFAEGFPIFNNITGCLKNANNSEVTSNLEQILRKNPDLRFVGAFVNKDAVHIAKCPQFQRMSPLEMVHFAFAPQVSCEVERSFNVYKGVLRDNWHSFEIDNLKKHLIVQSFSKINK